VNSALILADLHAERGSKMKKKVVFLVTLAIALVSVSAWAGTYQYVSADDLKQKLEKHEDVLLLDIQVANEFAQHHLAGAIATYAYPVKSESDIAKLQTVLVQAIATVKPVIIICPRGAGGAKRTYDYLKNQGVSEARLLILEGGQQKWPFQQLLAKE
jgi:rhodanese-related sulfurtransferase